MNGKDASSFGIPRAPTPSTRRGRLSLLQCFYLLTALTYIHLVYNERDHARTLSRVQRCTISNLHANLSFLTPATPIAASEFISRRRNLAKALRASGADAFILEPGYAFQYYGNVSQRDWEPWEPEERPMLMVVRPRLDAATGEVAARTSFLSPRFEEGRVRMLGIPAEEEALEVVTWEEDWDPYGTLRDGLFGGRKGVRVMVEEEMREFIARGLRGAGFETVGVAGEVEAVRQVKSAAEVEILRAVNTGTVEAVRAMRPCLVPGLTEDEVREVLDSALLSIGFSLFFNIVLFEENAALPHGGFATGDKVLEEETMVLIDVGAHHLGYSSDITRSFFIPPARTLSPFHRLRALLLLAPRRPPAVPADPALHAEKLLVWSTVFSAQSAALHALTPNATAARVDRAARSLIAREGYGDAFTHRVGHGIGIKAHEGPYLHSGNEGARVRAGMVFAVEPGVYLVGRFGVRIEDVVLVRGGEREGEGAGVEVLTGRRAAGPYEP